MRAATTRQVTVQGTLLGTANSTDITVNGHGLIPVTTVSERGESSETRPLSLTTTGSFTKDDEGFLRTQGGLQLLGWPTDESGNTGTVRRESAADLVPVNLNGFDFSPSATSQADLAVNLPSSAVAGDTYAMSVEYFDAIGNSHSLAFDYTSVDPALGTWSMEITDSSTATIVGEAELTFSSGGAAPGSMSNVTTTIGAYDPVTGAITVAGASNPIDITIGALGETNNLTQFASEFAPVSITKDGAPIGFLEGVEVNDQGFIEGIYDTGQRRSLFQIPIAHVSNPEGLEPGDNQSFRISSDSGPVYLWDSGAGPTGSLSGYTLEQSTTDITEELTQLIETQRAYSSNAKIVQTVDEMMQETTNLKR